MGDGEGCLLATFATMDEGKASDVTVYGKLRRLRGGLVSPSVFCGNRSGAVGCLGDEQVGAANAVDEVWGRGGISGEGDD